MATLDSVTVKRNSVRRCCGSVPVSASGSVMKIATAGLLLHMEFRLDICQTDIVAAARAEGLRRLPAGGLCASTLPHRGAAIAHFLRRRFDISHESRSRVFCGPGTDMWAAER